MAGGGAARRGCAAADKRSGRELRGTGFFYALELVKNKETRETFSGEECEWLLPPPIVVPKDDDNSGRGSDFLSSALFE